MGKIGKIIGILVGLIILIVVGLSALVHYFLTEEQKNVQRHSGEKEKGLKTQRRRIKAK